MQKKNTHREYFSSGSILNIVIKCTETNSSIKKTSRLWQLVFNHKGINRWEFYLGASSENVKEIIERNYNYNFRLQNIKFGTPGSPFLFGQALTSSTFSWKHIKEHLTTHTLYMEMRSHTEFMGVIFYMYQYSGLNYGCLNIELSYGYKSEGFSLA